MRVNIFRRKNNIPSTKGKLHINTLTLNIRNVTAWNTTHDLDSEELPNGLYIPKLPGKDWDNEHVMANGDGYTSEDAAKVLEYLWWQYADDIEVVFYLVFKLCDEVRIEYDRDGGRLVEKFINYPRRPCLQSWCGTGTDRTPDQDWEHLSLQEPDRLVRGLWHDWLLKIESLYVDLKDTIGRSPLAEREHQDNVAFGRVVETDNSSPDNLWWPLNVLMGFTSSVYGCTAVEMTGTEVVLGSEGSVIEQAKAPKELKDLAARMRKMDLQQDGSPPAVDDLMQE